MVKLHEEKADINLTTSNSNNHLTTICLLALLSFLFLSSNVFGQGEINFSPVYKHNPKGVKILGKYSNKYYMVKGLHHPWQVGQNDKSSLYQNYQDSYPESKINFFDTIRHQELTVFNNALEKTTQTRLPCSDSIIQTSACFTYQGIIWLYYVHKQGKKAVLKLQKFDLSGDAINAAHSLMKTRLNESNEAIPFFIQMNGDLQRFLVLNNKRFKVFNTRMKEKFTGTIPYHHIRQIRIMSHKIIYLIDQKKKDEKQVFDFVKYYPRIGTESRSQIKIKDQPVNDAIFQEGRRRGNIQLIGIGGKPFSRYFVQTFDRSTFKLQDQFSGAIGEKALENLDLQNNTNPFCIKTVKNIYDKKVMVIKEKLKAGKPAKGGSGHFILNTLRQPGKNPQTSVIRKATAPPNTPDYHGLHLFSQGDELHGLFNRFSKEEHKGLYKLKFPGKSLIKPEKILRSKEGGVIVAPRLIKATGDHELLFFGFDQNEYRLIKYQVN